MATLIVKDLPMGKELDRRSMAAIRGGNGMGSAPASVTTTSASRYVPTTSTGASVQTTSIGQTTGTTGAGDFDALDMFFQFHGAANGDLDALFNGMDDMFR